MWFYFDYVLCIWTHGFVSIAGSYNTNEKPFLMDQHNITKLMFQNLLSNDKKSYFFLYRWMWDVHAM
jgi:hypothetical protein